MLKEYNLIKIALKIKYETIDQFQENLQLSDQPKHILETVFMFGIGIIVILMQLNLTLLVAVITMFFNIIIGGKEAIEYASKSTTVLLTSYLHSFSIYN